MNLIEQQKSEIISELFIEYYKRSIYPFKKRLIIGTLYHIVILVLTMYIGEKTIIPVIGETFGALVGVIFTIHIIFFEIGWIELFRKLVKESEENDLHL